MDKVYEHKSVEEKIYGEWEEKGYFKPEVHKKGKAYAIILPPPNANAPLHFGHAVYTIEDILIRYHRMKGERALWLPGADHAGFETQFVFEKQLEKEGKSRFDYDREILYQMIWDYVQKNRSGMESQLKRLGFSLDWSRKKFTMDEDIVQVVYKTFKKMHDEKLIYRGLRLVNYCIKDGTSFSDLEVNHQEKEDSIYYIKYPFVDGSTFITVATTRPETMLGDTAVAVNPKDARYKKLVGKMIALPLTQRKISVIFDETVDMNFGTGAVKVTPAHDQADNDRARRHNLPLVSVIGLDGQMTTESGKYKDLWFKKARENILEDLKKLNLIEREEKIIHQVPVCYKCKTVIQPLLMEQWFVEVEKLKKSAIDAVKSGKIKIHPKRFEKIYFQWLEGLQDWNISRQVVWGIRIPAWKNTKIGEWRVTDGKAPQGEEWVQDADTFDTWFSSAQWPFATLQTTKKGDFETFYPNSVMETGYDILKAWVSRMVIMGLYVTQDIPFRDIVLHGLVNDPMGKKMSKSKGNVVNPLELVNQYGADAVRFALVYGTALGNDQVLSYPKLEAMRKFTNKLWNMARFIEMKRIKSSKLKVESLKELKKGVKNESDKKSITKVESLVKEITKDLESYNFNYAAEKLYDFAWHEFADKYIEDIKTRIDESSSIILNSLFLILLKLLHPFMPFVTEEIYQRLYKPEDYLIISSWPE